MVEVSDIFKVNSLLHARNMILRARSYPRGTVLRAYYRNAYCHARWMCEPENTFLWKRTQSSQDYFDKLTKECSHG